MKTIMLLAALALGIAMTHQAFACDWGLHADASDRTIVTSDGTGCRAIEPSTAQQRAGRW